MSKRPDDVSLNIFDLIDSICREFRAEWKQGKRPKIEEWIVRVPSQAQPQLFHNLLEAELTYRRRQKEQPSTTEYLRRFPNFERQIRQAFHESTIGSADGVALNDHINANRSAPVKEFVDANTQTYALAGASRLGDYELIRELGRGGMGVVYEARHTKTGNRVALKTLPTGHDGQEINADRLYRFRKEFRSLSEINHPNLVGMQSLEVDGSQWFFTMDLIEGEDFLSYVRPNDQLDLDRLRSALGQLVHGVQRLHERGIVHRDLKPSNVLVERDGTVKVLDFGLVAQLQKLAEMTATKSEMFAGTPKYAAPEQLFGLRTEASDWYAVGAMLYEALISKMPFDGQNAIDVLRRKHAEDPPQLQVCDNVPEDLATLVNGVLKREPAERLSSVTIMNMLQLESQTRTRGSTGTVGSKGPQGSHESGGSSADPVDELDPALFNQDEIILIGRETQLAQLEDARQAVLRTRKPAVVWVTGLSGEGKSSLVEHFLRPLKRGKEMLVLAGRCYDRESVPFKAIDSIIDPLVSYLRSLSDDELERLIPPDIEMLVRIFPVLRRVKSIDRRVKHTSSATDERAVRNLAFAAFGELLFSIAKVLPIVVSIDDLQWGDADSAMVFRNLLDSRISPTVLMLGTCRRDELAASPFLSQWITPNGDAEVSPTPIEVAVQPLTKDQCREFFEGRMQGIEQPVSIAVDELFESTKGNPYFLTQLIEGFDLQTGVHHPIPLNQIVEEKLKLCPIGARDLLSLIAVSGKATFISTIVALSECPSTVLATLTHMRSERLVRLLGTRAEPKVDTYHDKIRESILTLMQPEIRRHLHLRLAEYIEQQHLRDAAHGDYEGVGDWVFDLARHFTDAKDPRAFTYQLLAGQRSLKAFALEPALDHFRHARSLRPSNIELAADFQLHQGLGQSLSRLWQLEESLKEFEHALPLAPSKLDRAKCLHSIAELHWRNSEYVKAWANFRSALAEVGERLPTTKAGRILKTLQSMFMFHCLPRWYYGPRRQAASEELRLSSQLYAFFNSSLGQQDITMYLLGSTRGVAIARCLEASTERANAYASYMYMLSLVGFSSLAKRVKSQLERDYQINSDSEFYIGYLGCFFYCTGQLDAAIEHLESSGLALFRSGSYLRWPLEHLLWHSWAIKGSTAHIIHHASNESAIATAANDRIILAYSKYGLAEGLAKQGHTDRALKLADESVAELKDTHSTFVCVGLIQRARVQIQIGNYSAARESLILALKDIPKLRFIELTIPAFLLYVEAVLSDSWIQPVKRIKLPDRIRIAWLLRIARFGGWLFPAHRCAVWRMKGRFAAAKGNARRAIRCFVKAIEAAEHVGARYELARTLIDRSMLKSSNKNADRERGLSLLESIGCVLPEAEVDYLGIDREAHHARAASAAAAELAEIEQAAENRWNRG